ncbi:MAG: TolC family protein [Melioribacteraceae bacterium]|jgi:outer membrane protein TolC|nr:TolC family protein [Melioribacteraceae bacterium]
MKRLLFIILLLTSHDFIIPQKQLTLEECYEKARINYPLIKQKDYSAKTKDYSVSNIWNGYFPQITLLAQASYQSDVTEIPMLSPGIVIQKLSKDQYKVTVDVTQTIYDGGIMGAQAGIQESVNEIDNQKIEIDLLKIKERVTQIYLGILLIEAQLNQIDLVINDLTAGISKIDAAHTNGTATRSDVDVLRAELLKTEQRKIELNSSRISYINMLSLLINEKLNKATIFSTPPQINFLDEEITRPELKMYSAQKNLIENQNEITVSKIVPKANLFFQGGYGKPGLNMFINDFDWFYITGIRFSWSLSNLYSYGNESEINQLNLQRIDAQTETFMLNTKITTNQQLLEIDKLKKLIEVDKSIIDLRTSVKETAKAKLKYGVITSNDYIRDLNAEDTAKQNLEIHKIQLLLAQYNYKITTGN